VNTESVSYAFPFIKRILYRRNLSILLVIGPRNWEKAFLPLLSHTFNTIFFSHLVLNIRT
jgi:hypothetical protein